MSSSSSSSQKPSSRQPRKWTVAEDQKLREEVETQMIEGEVKDWCRIAAKLPGRTNKDCRKRWHNSVAGGLKKGQWSKSEDIQLARGVQQHGQRWTLIASVVGSRSADQCAKRWQQSLDPDLDRSEWRDEEDRLLIEAVQKLGRHWKDIQRHHFAGRSKNCIKNRYTVLVRRYQNQGITLPQPAGTPEPGAYSATDDDDMPYGSAMYDDMMNGRTQVSTPETRHSWPMDDTFSGWTSQDSYPMTSTSADFHHVQHALSAPVSQPAQWGWATTSMSHGSMVPMVPSQGGFTNMADHAAFTSYDSSYGSAPALVGAGQNHFLGSNVRAPTSSPVSRNLSASPYDDAQTMAHYMRYAVANDGHYRY